VQTNKTPKIPIILVGAAFWGGLVEWFKERLVTDKLISPEDMDLLQIIDEPEEIAAAIFRHYESSGFTHLAPEHELLLNL
jgi:predicted Rossmann-fold nucleotide-binding protein